MNNINRIQLCQYLFRSLDVPEEFDGFRFIFICDIHHGRCFPAKNLRGLVTLVNAMKPDAILLGGDYVDHDPECIVTFFKEAARFSAPVGVFGVLGNHDRRTDADLSLECMKESGITLLDNDAVWVERGGERIRLGGVGDLWTTTQDIRPMLKGTRKEDLMILLSHHPDFAELLPSDKIDLMLCGHTHGGQVSFLGKWIPPWPGSAKHKYLTGIMKEGDTTVIISNGVGTVGPPVRVFAKPQIWEITLKREAEVPIQ
ncbi:MAG: metallophosphoesterase [Clostridia bacterium]|nr:metallophosphoesterase [Clostridia bacterium]MDR3645553.1 metallophosphoesterase [Clostridia bacterium]